MDRLCKSVNTTGANATTSISTEEQTMRLYTTQNTNTHTTILNTERMLTES